MTFILLRPKLNSTKPVTFEFYRKTASPDLSNHVFLRIIDARLEEWVHKDDYKIWKKIHEKEQEKRKFKF